MRNLIRTGSSPVTLIPNYDLSKKPKGRFNFFGKSKVENESKSNGEDEEHGGSDVRGELRALKKKMLQLEKSHAREIQDLKHQVQEEMQALIANGAVVVPRGDSPETEKSSSETVNDAKAESHPDGVKSRGGGGRGGFSFFRTYDKFIAPAEDGSETYLDNDTFTLMMVHRVCSQAWALGILSYFFEMILGTLIALDQINLSEGSSLFDVPFNVDTVVRIGQFFSIFLCLSTQTDMLTSVQNLVILGTGNKWNEAIGERNNKNVCVWLIRILLPNLLKFSQGLLVMFVSFVIIVQSDNIIDLLKDFTALMVLSETDNIMFHLATQGYLGQTLLRQTANATDRSVDTSSKSSNSIVPLGSTGGRRKVASRVMAFFNFRPLILLALFAPMLGGWVVIIQNQMNGQYFRDKYPKCKVNGDADEAFELAKRHFGDGVCWGGPLNSFDCEFEDGDCVRFNIAYPLCKGRDELVDVQEKMDNGVCDAAFMISDCDYDGGDCCPYRLINSPTFGDGLCHARSSTKECGYDNGDCNTFHRKYPDCPYTQLEQLNKIQLYVEPVLGNGVCESGHYAIRECGWEDSDCDFGQIGQDIIINDVHEIDISTFNSRRSLDGMSVAIGGDKGGLQNSGNVTVFTYDKSFKAWIPRGNRLIGIDQSQFGKSLAISEKGDRLAVGAPEFGSFLGQVKVFDYNPSHDKWEQVGQDLSSESLAATGSLVELSADGTRLAISEPWKNWFAGQVSVFDLNPAKSRWEMVGNPIQGSYLFENLGIFDLKLSSLKGDVVLASSGQRSSDQGLFLRVFKLFNNTDWNEIESIDAPDLGTSVMSEDGSRIAVGLNATLEDQGEVVIFDFNEISNQFEQVGETLFAGRDGDGNLMQGFGRSLSMSSDGQILSVGLLDPRCTELPDVCATGFVMLYLFDPVNKRFMEMIHRFSPYHVLPRRPSDSVNSIIGLDMSLNRDGTSISFSGYDLQNDNGFVRVNDLTEHFFTRYVFIIYVPNLFRDMRNQTTCSQNCKFKK